jgi:hypothetical protein
MHLSPAHGGLQTLSLESLWFVMLLRGPREEDEDAVLSDGVNSIPPDANIQAQFTRGGRPVSQAFNLIVKLRVASEAIPLLEASKYPRSGDCDLRH